MVPLVTLYINDDDDVPDLLGSTQKVVLDALDSAGVEIELDGRKLYAKGGIAGGSSQEASIGGDATSTRRYHSQSQSQRTPPRNLLCGSDGRSMAKKPGSRTPLAALNQKKTKKLTN